jgi:hypothetical protein
MEVILGEPSLPHWMHFQHRWQENGATGQRARMMANASRPQSVFFLLVIIFI